MKTFYQVKHTAKQTGDVTEMTTITADVMPEDSLIESIAEDVFIWNFESKEEAEKQMREVESITKNINK